MYTDDAIREIVSSWGLEITRFRPDIDIAGSPERTSHRLVVEDDGSGLWVLEAIPPGTGEHKLRICRTLAWLHERGLDAVHPYLPDPEGRLLVQRRGKDWQIRPFVEGALLPRPEYLRDRWRGGECAGFLLALRDKSRELPFSCEQSPFSMTGFIHEMVEIMAEYNPETHGRMKQAVDFIEREFIDLEGAFPVVFCHGDFHPLNVIWSEDGIKSVIDWEFLGYRPEVYDVANLIGCLGFEEPAGLSQGFVAGLLSGMKEANVLSPLCWQHLVEWVIAIRFAWLSDWLRRRDREMIDLEVTYIHLLIDNRRDLKAYWEREVGPAD
jgi:homoserine kinase type II